MYNLLSDEEARIIDFFHTMHAHPELSNEEFETTAHIKAFLSTLSHVELLPIATPTGVLAKIEGPHPGPTIGLRCDIDAIAQTEKYPCEFQSVYPGKMHACGHDFHTAALLGAAQILNRRYDELKGTAVLLFQCAEETTTGADSMIRGGLFELTHPDMFFGLHNWPLIPVGKVICKEGALMAAKTNFGITIHGRGGHGSMPHLNVDPIVCAASAIMSLQTVLSRNIDPFEPVVLSINAIEGGSFDNLVVDSVRIAATIRTLSTDAMARAKTRMEKLIHDTCAAYECTATIVYHDNIPLTFNSQPMYKLAVKAAARVVDNSDIITVEPTMASEDFAKIMANVPSFMYWFGSGTSGVENHALHDPYFHVDEQGIKTASEVLASSVFTAQETRTD
ncbi:M20 family metallopeptidase [Peptoniphilus equinus]|uniref:M20 family metallopeptidase n=1 Tax=Peptoniphilus equinus TaxID=3016343 RepID=A0ABY7QRY4_9FIRM|nr:M20 family metallopeptidase [Peptoniphilus equinus]WBW49552.1 M20 family metallopeptidase [Peptoniphilus equinus]